MVVALVLVLGACRTDWAQWGNGPERNGDNPLETDLSWNSVADLEHQWATDLGGYVNAAPVLAIDIPVNGVDTDLIFVGTELGDFYAVKTDGQVLWKKNIGFHGADCPDTPGNVFGVQGTAVFDRERNRVYAMGGNGDLFALDPATGATAGGWPVRITNDPVHNSVYSALTLFENKLYVETGSHCDQRPYRGRVTRINVDTRAPITWFVSGSSTGPEGGGIWAWGGASVDPANGDVYVATGNLFTDPENTPYGDAVVRLTGDLQVVASHAPGVLIGDDDFGSTPTLFQAPGCPPQFAVEQKNGSLYLYDRDNIAAGPRQTVVMAQGADFNHDPIPVHEFIGSPAWSPQTGMLYVSNPTGTPDGFYTHGMAAFRVNSDCKLQLQWQTQAGTQDYVVGSPTVANGVVYYPAGANQRIYAFHALTGASLWNSGTDVPAPIFTAPMVVNGHVYAGAYDNKLHAWGLPTS